MKTTLRKTNRYLQPAHLRRGKLWEWLGGQQRGCTIIWAHGDCGGRARRFGYRSPVASSRHLKVLVGRGGAKRDLSSRRFVMNPELSLAGRKRSINRSGTSYVVSDTSFK